MSMMISLKNNREFLTVYKKGKSYANRCLIMYVYENEKNEGGNNRIGISVSKKVGNSVVRHRIKRLVKESYRLNCDRLLESYDIVVVARKEAKDKSFREIEKSLFHLFKLHHLIVPEIEKI